MQITVNSDKKIVEEIRNKIRQNGGYCPCKINKTDDTLCICKEFQEQEEDGYCHCGLYYKQND